MSGNGGSSGTVGGFVDGGSCYTGTAPPPTSVLTGSSFEPWEREPVRGCLIPSQSFPPSCATSTVIGGSFSLTSAVCTAFRWEVTVGSVGHQVNCWGGSAITPANCWCRSGNGPDPGAAGAPGLGCDAGPSDAAGQ